MDTRKPSTAFRLSATPQLSLEDEHFHYVEELNECGSLTLQARRRLWLVEQELNHRAIARKPKIV